MATLTRVTVILLGVVGGTTALAALLATGCSSSSSPSDGGLEDVSLQEDVGADAKAKLDSGKDTTEGVKDGGGDATDGAPVGDAADASDATDGAEIDASDAAHAADSAEDASDAAEAADVSDAANASDASDAALSCVTLISALAPSTDAGAASDAGADAEGGAVASVLVTGFDTNVTNGWSVTVDSFVGVDGGPVPTFAYSPTVGDTCPGSLALTVPFTTYGGQQIELSYDYNGNLQGYPPWTNHTQLHYSVMVAFESSDGGTVGADAGAFDLGAISAIGDYAQWNGYSNLDDNHGTENFPNWYLQNLTYGTWLPVTMLLSDNTVDGGDVVPTGTGCGGGNACKFSTSLNVPATMPAGGPAAPTTTILYIDDIWLE
jgi:hypothetical protein